MADYSDYNKPRTNLLDYLPEVYNSDVNVSVMENLFNRFLTKPELTRVQGLIGRPTTLSQQQRLIPEPTPNRQYFQLQPLLYAKIGTINHLASWNDILNELGRIGVDIDTRVSIWGSALQFNWAPPIDINKVVNYLDYFWYNPTNYGQLPDYIVARNDCTVFNARINAYQNNILNTVGDQLSIVDIDSTLNVFVVDGNSSGVFIDDFPFYTIGTSSPTLNDKWWTTLTSSYDVSTNQTTIEVVEDITVEPISMGQISLVELRTLLELQRNVVCTGLESPDGLNALGWDAGDWDGSATNEGWSGFINFQPTSGQIKTPTINQWIIENKWQHKSDIPNFTVAKQADIPVLEFIPTIELNEWTVVTYKWNYRQTIDSAFEATTVLPSLLELKPFVYFSADSTDMYFELDESYGNVGDVFVEGYRFRVFDSPNPLNDKIYSVNYTTYQTTSDSGNTFRTRIYVNEIVAATISGIFSLAGHQIEPIATSVGDPWLGYNQQWMFDDVNTTTPVNHQEENPLQTIDLSQTFDAGDYTYNVSENSQLCTIQLDGLLTINIQNSPVRVGGYRSRTELALLNSGDVRVYVNGIRQYGNYSELGTSTVTGIEFSFDSIQQSPNAGLVVGDVVLIELGEAARSDIGLYDVSVRVDADNNDFVSNGPIDISLTHYKREEQVKVERNQYPLFDLYTTDGNTAFNAAPIFAYAESQDQSINETLGKRIITEGAKNYVFENSLVVENNGEMYAYRDYAFTPEQYWYDCVSNILYYWTGFTWTDMLESPVTASFTYYIKPIMSSSTPDIPWLYNGVLWFNPELLTLFQYNSGNWDIVETDIFKGNTDPTLQTVWKKGLNDEEYVPKKLDGIGRIESEYDEQEIIYVAKTTEELIQQYKLRFPYDTLSASEQQTIDQQMAIKAQELWIEKNTTDWSPTGEYTSEWEIPQQLYNNPMHENREFVTFRQLFRHFLSIVEAQVPLFGLSESKSAAWRILETPNMGLGGTIKEHNDSFDSMLSSIFVNNVTPVGLLEFAHDQYEIQLNAIIDLFTNSSAEFLQDTSIVSFVGQIGTLAEIIIAAFEFNDQWTLIYRDTTSFNADTGNGVRNWVMTLPTMGVIPPVVPVHLYDPSIDVNEIVHHDGHRKNYALIASTLEILVNRLVNTPDVRTSINGIPQDTLGRIEPIAPPFAYVDFNAAYGSLARSSVYWYHVGGGNRVLYRLSAYVQAVQPALGAPQESYWIDTANGVLKQLQGLSWVEVHVGSDDITEAWELIDMNFALGEVILEVEQRLYTVANDDPCEEYFDFDSLRTDASENAFVNSYYEDAFLDFVHQSDIVDPFDTSFTYDPGDPFTWNYKYSPILKYPTSTSYGIAMVNIGNNSFVLPTIKSIISNNLVFGSKITVEDPTTSPPTFDVFTVKSVIENNLTGTTTIMVVEEILITTYLAMSFTLSGGYWKDLYTKLYGTPVPHLEPWSLQGYISKPDYWDNVYSNDNEDVYGTRRWKYLHRIPLIVADNVLNTFTVAGDVTSAFPLNELFTVTRTPGDTNPFGNTGAYLVASVSYNSSGNITIITVVYSPFTLPPGVTDGVATTDINGGISVGMWDNIRLGRIPVGLPLPNGDLSTGSFIAAGTYSYFSVNINNVPCTSDDGSGGAEDGIIINPDEIFPPYWASLTCPITAADSRIRSVYTSYNSEIIVPGANYQYGDRGTVEYVWRFSSQYLYDELEVMFRMQPTQYTHMWLGTKYYNVAGLDVNRDSGKVFAHQDTIFHGDLIDNGVTIFKVNGLLQWYTNYNRYTAVDSSYSDFRDMWTDWTPPLSYQTATFLDATSADFQSKFACLTNSDYEVIIKRSPGIDELNINAFNVAITNMPPKYITYDTQYEWRFMFDIFSNATQELEYYPVHQYQFRPNIVDNICSLYTYPMEGLNTTADTFVLSGNKTEIFPVNGTFEVFGSSGNDGTYTTVVVVYDSSTNLTIIEVVEDIIDPTIGGFLKSDFRTHPWQTGDQIILTSTHTLPNPFQPQILNRYYYIIRIDDTQFQLAETLDAAKAGIEMDILSPGIGDQFVGQLMYTFTASKSNAAAVEFRGQQTPIIWRHFAIDTREVLSITPPFPVVGMQRLINFIDGYEAYTTDIEHFSINHNKELVDPDSGRLISWQLEIERFIDWAYQLRVNLLQVNDRYEVTADDVDDVFDFVNSRAAFNTGDKITLKTSGTMPQPILQNTPYYVIRLVDEPNKFQLGSTITDANTDNPIDLITSGSGTIVASTFVPPQDFPIREINPFRVAIWVEPEQGVVSNIITGPHQDVRQEQTIYDQYGRSFTSDVLRIYRQDKLTQIGITDGIFNDIVPSTLYGQTDAYDFLHISGANVFLDGYEHIVKFNNYTTVGDTIYDPFVGLNIPTMEVQFNRQADYTQRPNVGGYYLLGNELHRNIESGVVDMQNYYDTFDLTETIDVAKYSRAIVGYDGIHEYMNKININPKSQFLFYRGMIQHKGSKVPIDAYIQSRFFIDASIDEFWAYKVAEFGGAGQKEYPEMWILGADTQDNTFQMQFVREGELEDSGLTPKEFVDDGFTPIRIKTTNRWYNQPDQESILSDTGGMLFDAKTINKFEFTVS